MDGVLVDKIRLGILVTLLVVLIILFIMTMLAMSKYYEDAKKLEAKQISVFMEIQRLK